MLYKIVGIYNAKCMWHQRYSFPRSFDSFLPTPGREHYSSGKCNYTMCSGFTINTHSTGGAAGRYAFSSVQVLCYYCCDTNFFSNCVINRNLFVLFKPIFTPIKIVNFSHINKISFDVPVKL